MTQFGIKARVRQLLQGIDQRSPGDEEIVGLSEQGAILVAIDTSAYGELTRIGRSFECHTTTAIAAVVARPTTAVMLAIYNNEPDDGRVIIVDRAWALNEVSTAVASQCTILGVLGQVREAVPADSGLAINQNNGMGAKDTRARSILNATALPAGSGIAGNWRVLPSLGGQKPGAAATPGYFASANIDGRIVCPPGRYFGIHIMANVVGETFTCGIEWHEKNIKLG